MKDSIREAKKVTRDANRAVTFMLLSLFMKRSAKPPTRGRKIMVERIGRFRVFIIKYSDILIHPLWRDRIPPVSCTAVERVPKGQCFFLFGQQPVKD